MSYASRIDDAPSLQPGEIQRALGQPVAELIGLVARQAQDQGVALYLAGGVLRDLLLRQRSLDLDFVVEGEAVRFASRLARQFGGSAQDHAAFGTARWRLDESAIAGSLASDQLPAHVDFAMARVEIYAHSAALPTVAASDIASDLARRDFTVNALALQLSPAEGAGRLLDPFDGSADLAGKRIRALHENSFIDDPTRILRAARYARRLEFEIEATTAQWMRAALPCLRRVSGQRLRNEIALALREPEAGAIMLWLQDLGALRMIHPAFQAPCQLRELPQDRDGQAPPWSARADGVNAIGWIILLSATDANELESLCARLALTRALTKSVIAGAKLAARLSSLDDPAMRPSDVVKILDGYPDDALRAGWLLAAERPRAQANIGDYAADWRHRRATITGNDLKAMGIPPGPRYRQILDRLRYAWIDAEAHSAEDERRLLRRLLAARD